MRGVLAVRAFKQKYEVTPQIRELLEAFRLMANTCIRLGLQSNKTSRNALTKLCYHELSAFNLHTWYRVYAISVAASALKGYRKALRKGLTPKKPYIHKLFTVYGANGSENGIKIENGKLRLPIKPREYFYIPLSDYVLRNVSDPALRLGSVVITASTLSISVKKNAAPIESRGYVSIDINEGSAITASESGEIKDYGFRDVPKVIQAYRKVMSNFKRNDVRVRRRIFGKYGSKTRNKVIQRLHIISKRIVQEALDKKQGIILENLTDIRESHRRGNYEGRTLRHRLNSWPFHELQRQIIYKAAWKGIPTVMVDASRTSKLCSICGSMVPKVQKWLVCHACGSIFNRHENAARNILARGVRFAPIAPKIEAMVQERTTPNPESRFGGVSSHPTET